MKFTEIDINRLASFPEQNPNPVVELNVNGEVTYFNPATLRYFPDFTNQQNDHDLLISIRNTIGQSGLESLHGRKSELKVGEYVFEKKFFYFKESDLIRIYFNDITEFKHNEGKLSQLALFPIQNPNPVFEVDTVNGVITFKNPAAEKLLPGLFEALPAHPVFSEISKHLKDRIDFTCEIKVEESVFEQKVFFIPKSNLVRIYLHDLTERKKTERNLARLASFPEQNPNPIVELDLQGQITYINQACQKLFPDLLSQKFEHSLFRSFKSVFPLLVSGDILENSEEIIVNEQYFIQRVRVMPEMGLVRVFHTDITSQKKAESIIREKNKDITDSINYARRIQQSILPNEGELKERLGEHFVLYLPKDIVSGDFYWSSVKVSPDDPEQVYNIIAAVDCTGHGVPGALMSLVGCTLLNQTIKNPNVVGPAQALDFLNQELPKNLRAQNPNEDIKDGMDMSIVAITKKKMIMHFAGANNPIYFIRNRELTEIKGDKQPISGSNLYEKKKFTPHKMEVQKGDLVYLFTDGFADQFGGPKGKKFMYKQLKEKLVEFSHLAMDAQKENLKRIFEEWKGSLNQVDDVLIIGIKI